MPYVVISVSWLDDLQPGPRDQVRDRGLLGRDPDQRDRLDEEGGDRRPADDQRAVVAEQRDQRDRGEEHEPQQVADDHGVAAVEPVGHHAGDRAEDQRRQQPDGDRRRRTPAPLAALPVTCCDGEDRRWPAGRASRRTRRRRARATAGGTAGCAGRTAAPRSRTGRPAPAGRRLLRSAGVRAVPVPLLSMAVPPVPAHRWATPGPRHSSRRRRSAATPTFRCRPGHAGCGRQYDEGVSHSVPTAIRC